MDDSSPRTGVRITPPVPGVTTDLDPTWEGHAARDEAGKSVPRELEGGGFRPVAWVGEARNIPVLDEPHQGVGS